MESLEIAVSTREATGKGGARKMRREGRVPGILYSKRENLKLAVELSTFNKLLRVASAGNALLDVKVEGGATLKALIKEIQHDPVTGTPVHFDFLHIELDQSVRVVVPIHLQGTPIGVKRGGVLEERIRELELECVAASIPQSIDVDISELGPNDAIHVRDIEREGITFLTSPDLVIAHVISKKTLDAADAAEEAAAAAAAAALAPPSEETEGAAGGSED